MRRRRWLLLTIGFPFYVVALMLLAQAAAVIIDDPPRGIRTIWGAVAEFIHGDLDDFLGMFGQEYIWRYFGGPALLVAITQLLFLIPIVRGPHRGQNFKSLRISLLMIGLVASGLAAGLFLAIVQLVRMISGDDETFINDSVVGWCGYVIAPLAISWVVWTMLVLSFAKRNHHSRLLGRWIGILMAGTLIELIVVLPLDIMVRRRTNCYCDSGTAHTLGFAAWALLWLTGPGIVLAITSKRRRLWWDTHCVNCGYEKGPSPGEKCPECGFNWGVSVTRSKPQAAD